MRRGPKPAKSKAESKPPVARKSPKDESTKVRDLEKRLAEALRDKSEALEQQTATREILRVIASSPTDIQPVLDTVAESAARLCESFDSAIWRQEGEQLRLVAHHGPIPATILPIVRGTIAGRAVLEARTLHFANAQSEGDEFPESSVNARREGWRSILSVPLMREGVATGAIVLRRAEARLFSERQVALLQTFADQAVIAIENVRLFNETKEALEQQTATAEILRVISSSPTDIQPVLDAVVRNAARLCEGYDVWIGLTERENLRVRAHHGPIAIAEELRPIRRGRVSEVAVLDRRTIHVHDITASGAEFPQGQADALRIGHRTTLGVPLLREGQAIGVIMIRRLEVRPFTDKQIELLQTFADQAVIAIENVRLFTELQEKNQSLTKAHAQVSESLEQQTATSEILRVISQSQTDAQPVFEIIAERAGRLCEAEVSVVSIFDGGLLQLAASHGMAVAGVQLARDAFPIRPDAETVTSRAFRARTVVHVPDVLGEQHFETTPSHRAAGFRGCLGVPMLHEGKVIGVIFLARTKAEPYADSQIELVKTFADQAVIAIENVRLFNELEARTLELTRSVGQLTALGEVGRAVSSTLDLETVLSTIVSRAIQLSGTDGGSVYEYDEATEEFSLRASRDLPEAYVEQVRDARPRKGEGAVGRVAETREPVQIADISDPAAYESRVRNTLLEIGLRALLAVPLIAEDRLVGALIVMRRRSGTFAAEEVTLLQTFATQSALAIQNARLFREIEDKSRQLEVASQHKSEFLANMSHELRTPLNAIIGFSEVLSERMFGELNEKQEEYLKDIYASGTHLLSLINDILDLSKIEAGRMELELTEFHLPTALDNALTLVRERAGRRGIALHLSVDERLGQLQADERKVRQVVLNLLSNAIKFTPEDGRIEVGAVPREGLVEVSVSDTGVGIAAEDQDAVFEEFRQVGTAAKKVEGTGLGLTLCRKFVELHGGSIWVKSELGVGSTFTFTIPVLHGE
jgi:two-component system, NtrC family, sensor kinase